MITEIIRYRIPLNQSEAFEAAYQEASEMLLSSQYCQGYELLRGIENPTRWTLLLRWDSVEAHVQGFRSSPEFLRFFALVSPFFEQIEEMEHYGTTGLVWPEVVRSRHIRAEDTVS